LIFEVFCSEKTISAFKPYFEISETSGKVEIELENLMKLKIMGFSGKKQTDNNGRVSDFYLSKNGNNGNTNLYSL
jgi:hypothetical protein